MAAKRKRKMRRNPGGPLDRVSQRELEIYVENNGQLHRSQEVPIRTNLINKMAKGVYDHAGAVKLYGYLMESGAKAYAKEFGGPGASWHEIFSPATRKAAAKEFAKSFETEARLGNYDHLLQKQYQGKWSGRGGKQNPVMRGMGGGGFISGAKVYTLPNGGLHVRLPAKYVGRVRNPSEIKEYSAYVPGFGTLATYTRTIAEAKRMLLSQYRSSFTGANQPAPRSFPKGTKIRRTA